MVQETQEVGKELPYRIWPLALIGALLILGWAAKSWQDTREVERQNSKSEAFTVKERLAVSAIEHCKYLTRPERRIRRYDAERAVDEMHALAESDAERAAVLTATSDLGKYCAEYIEEDFRCHSCPPGSDGRP